MADYPCDAHLARYKGPSVRAFLNMYREDEAIALRYSVCGDCLAEIVAAWLPRALAQQPEGHWDPLDEDVELESLWRPVDRSARGMIRNGRH